MVVLMSTTSISTSSNMFERASRSKLRFDTTKGFLSVEDLWQLPLTSTAGRANLDDIAIGLHRATREVADRVSFVQPSETNSHHADLVLAFEIVKYIIGVRIAERDELRAAADRREKKQRLLELIAKKQDQDLEGKSIDELRALAESL